MLLNQKTSAVTSIRAGEKIELLAEACYTPVR